MIDQILAAAGSDPAISRCLDPDIKLRLLARPGSRELPCVRGRTVVPERLAAPVILGYPNYFGVFDHVEHASVMYLTGAWSRLRPLPEDAITLSVEPGLAASVAAGALEEVRRLAKRLRQIRGVQEALRPQAPILVALLPRAPHGHTPRPPGVSLLDERFPEYPGGVRIEPPFNAAGFDPTRYAASVERFITEVE